MSIRPLYASKILCGQKTVELRRRFPELTTKARVGNSGDVYLPLIDYVHVADLTTEEAQLIIQKRLEDGGFVRSPHVTIFVDESWTR